MNLDSNINSDLNLNSTSERLVSVLVRIPVGTFIWQYWSLELWACDQNLIKKIKSDQKDQRLIKRIKMVTSTLERLLPQETWPTRCEAWQAKVWYVTNWNANQVTHDTPGDMWHIWHMECKMWHQADMWHKCDNMWHMWHTAALPGGMWWWLGLSLM